MSAAAAAERLHGDGVAFSISVALFFAGFVGMFLARRWFGLAERIVYLGLRTADRRRGRARLNQPQRTRTPRQSSATDSSPATVAPDGRFHSHR